MKDISIKDVSIKDVLRFNNLKIRNRSLINQLSRDELIYCHLHCCTNEDFMDELGEYELPLSKNDFNSIKKKLNLKKVKIDRIREDLLNYLESDKESNSNEWFDVSVFDNKGLSDNNVFYLLFFSLMNKELADVFRGFDKEKITDFLSKLSSYDSEKKHEYYVLKAVAAITVLDNLKNLADSDELINGIHGDKDVIKELSEDVKSEIDSIQKTLVLCIYNNYSLCCQDVINSMGKDIRAFESEIKKNNLQLEERNIKIKELKETVRELNRQLKNCQKVLELSDIKNSIKNIELTLKDIGKSNVICLDEIKNAKKSIVATSYENQIDNYITRVTDLKRELSSRTLELKDIKREFDSYKLNIEDNFIEYVRKNGLSDKILNFIENISDSDINIASSECSEVLSDVAVNLEDTYSFETPVVFDGLGYVSIEDNVHYINFPNGTKEEIVDLSDKIFLSEGQFIIVDKNYRLSKTTISKYEENGKSIGALRLGVVESVNPLTIRINADIIKDIKFDSSRAFYKLNQVIALNDDNCIVRAFRTIRFNADETFKSIRARGLDSYYVLDVFSNSFFKLRNIETGSEDIYNLDTNGIEISKFSVIFLRDLIVLSATSQSKFYTVSSFYKDRVVYGPIFFDNGIAKLKKQSGEVSLVNNIPENYIVENGDVIAVDEFNNFLYIADTEDVYVEKNMLKKTAKQIVNGKDNSRPIETKGEITIIGNLFYKNSYTMSFFKIGYKINMLHGYDTSINKIVQTAKDSEAIIVNTSYCSHDNFWQIKDEVKDGALSHLKYIFTQEDGANMLVHKFNELNSKDEVAITQ